MVFVATAWPTIFAQVQRGRMANDQLAFHEIVVRNFIDQFPILSYADYRSATTPGYHTLIAAMARVVGDARPVLQMLGSVFTVGLLATLGMTLGIRAGPRRATAIALPVVASLYVWPAGVWLLPDNAGWWGVLGVMLISLHLASSRDACAVRWSILGGVVLLLLVYARQIHLWAAAMLWTGAWLSGRSTASDSLARGPLDEWRALTARPGRSMRATMLAVATSIPAFLLVAGFVWLWGGLTPPMFQTGQEGNVGYHGGNPAAPAFVLAILAIVGVFYAGFVAPTLFGLLRDRPVASGAAVLAGAAAALVPETTHSVENGRWSGLWNIAGALPSIAGRTSPLILVLSVVGAVMVLGWALALRRPDRWVMLACLTAFAAAMATSFQLWHRYVEPLILILLAVMASRVDPTSNVHRRDVPGIVRTAVRLRLAGPIVLAVGFACLNVVKISTAKRIEPPASVTAQGHSSGANGARDFPNRP